MTAQPLATRNATARLKPWLLLWLVPWLFLSVASGGLHDHDWHGAASNQTTPCATQDASAGRNDHRSHANLHAAHIGTPHHECQACRWSAQSALALSVSAGPGVPVSQPVLAQPQALAAPLSLALPALRGRGPPSLWI